MTKASKRGAGGGADDLFGRLQDFAVRWRDHEGTEQAGAQQFLQSLLDVYGATFRPGTIFEQHPVRMVVRAGTQAGLFGQDSTPEYTTERMDMYLPRVCVWEMKAPAERDLGRHHEQVLKYWAHVRTRYMVLCNFREVWVYDTEDEGGQLQPKLRFTLEELPARGDALLFLRGDVPDLGQRTERVTADVAKMLGRLVRELVQSSKDPLRARDAATRFVLGSVFAMFAEDTDIIPHGMFTEVMREADKAGEIAPASELFEDFGCKQPDERTHRHAPYV